MCLHRALDNPPPKPKTPPKNKKAAAMSMNQQAMKDITAAAAVAKTLGYSPEAVGVPTMQV